MYYLKRIKETGGFALQSVPKGRALVPRKGWELVEEIPEDVRKRLPHDPMFKEPKEPLPYDRLVQKVEDLEKELQELKEKVK